VPRANQLQTHRLVIRRFTAEDWAQVQELAHDKESSEGGKYDHAWPTSEEGCRATAEYLAGAEAYWAACLRGGGRLIGLLALSHTDEPGTLDLGHVFHTGFVSEGHDAEALGCVMDYAFATCGAERIICNNAEAWTVQLAPLHELGMRIESRGDGSDFFQRDADGKPITFVGCRMAISRAEWLERRGSVVSGPAG
jgi:[ribosomal protein S5]-alanine N-acetyltransferase